MPKESKMGRPALYGAPMPRFHVRLPQEMADELERIGAGNRSEGVRLCLEAYREKAAHVLQDGKRT